MNTKKAKPLFHPTEIFICGFSGSGKTTLIEKLVPRLSQKLKLGYMKHDGHRFQMDRKGKDTDRIYKAGAVKTAISDHDRWASIQNDPLNLFSQREIFTDCEAVIVEGYKNVSRNKIAVLDKEGQLLKRIGDGDLEQVILAVGPEKRPEGLDGDIPFLHRDDIDGIETFLFDYFVASLQPKVSGLILAGGMSSRMGTDKSLLDYHGKAQACHLADLLGEELDDVFISLRNEQNHQDVFAQYKTIPDQLSGIGPMGGILSAMNAYPDRAWLVLACDLPLMDRPLVKNLLKERNPFALGTCYIDDKGLPEPMCAIYEARMRSRLYHAIGLGYQCPRKVLIQSHVKSLVQPYEGGLTNANHFSEYLDIKSQLHGGRES